MNIRCFFVRAQVYIHPDKYFENILNMLRHSTRIEHDRLGSPVNKTLWNTGPAIVNAYYNRNRNQISNERKKRQLISSVWI